MLDQFLNFLSWRDGIPSEYRGGELMYDVKGVYKYLTEAELFKYYFETF